VGKAEVLGRGNNNACCYGTHSYNGLVEMREKKSWTQIPPKSVHIILQKNSCIPIVEEWNRLKNNELKIDQSIYIDGLVKRIKRRARI